MVKPGPPLAPDSVQVSLGAALKTIRRAATRMILMGPITRIDLTEQYPLKVTLLVPTDNTGNGGYLTFGEVDGRRVDVLRTSEIQARNEMRLAMLPQSGGSPGAYTLVTDAVGVVASGEFDWRGAVRVDGQDVSFDNVRVVYADTLGAGTLADSTTCRLGGTAYWMLGGKWRK